METNKDSIDFRAYNEAGDWIYAYFDSSNEKTSGTINFEKAPE